MCEWIPLQVDKTVYSVVVSMPFHMCKIGELSHAGTWDAAENKCIKKLTATITFVCTRIRSAKPSKDFMLIISHY